ncbi:MAG TPA: hypothetical protein VLA82_08735 [Actinomycetota bacterium]|nr:hypothetical protein [Actinomycetota bacterium]
MNEESLRRANAFLSAVSDRVEVGGVLPVTPAEIGRELSMPDALSTARAVRALIARRRLEPAEGSYRLLDARPVDPSEPEAIARRPRRRAERPRPAAADDGSGTNYSDFGRALVDRTIDLGREVAQLRASLRTSREESRESQVARDEAERRARALSEKVKELEGRAEMAESNLRTLLASARSGPRKPDAAVSDTEMEAILGVLKGDGGQADDGQAEGDRADGASA